ncbi:uncharacterized protein CTRU02_200167 [Colletotrichum truncatum]|uniref:Uncharacterized protein n=1 Tax=Colletotrichum truncatum TaxID=5467 RepID=A0ACC3ZDU7_COLTU|nr:uncharacterized protein CTRU02_05043 [Colletotrichum truncatum]KAF6794842.1 hypothetical protein CTRU02_05043 [Colletotrichum truncatum]
MAELPASVPPSPNVPAIVNLGFQLANKLRLYGQGTKAPHWRITELGEGVDATTSALVQLWDFLSTDRYGTLAAYKEAGRKDVEDLATRCGKTYTTIIRTVYRASLADKVVEDVSWDAVGVEDLKAARLCAIKANMDWRMVRTAIQNAENQLEWLYSSLLLHFQVFDVARLQVKAPRAPGSFDEELASRAMASRLLCKRNKAAETLVEQCEKDAEIKAEREARLAKKAAKAAKAAEADAVSVCSNDDDDAATWKSGATAKESRPPSVCELKADKKDEIIVIEDCRPPPPPSVPTPAPVEIPTPVPAPIDPIDVKLVAPKRRFPSKVFISMAEWVQGLFGHGLPPLDHMELEATILQRGHLLPDRKPPVLALEPKILLRQLKCVLRKVGDKPGDQLIGLERHFRISVQDAPQRAQKKDGRNRSLIAVDTRGLPDFIVAYMSIDPAMEPIRLTDPLDRKIVLPYEQCRTLKGARTAIHNRFADIARLWPIVKDGAFEIVNEEGVVIPPGSWEAIIKPGAVLTMRLSAFNDEDLSSITPNNDSWAFRPAHVGHGRPPGMFHAGMPPRPGGMAYPPAPTFAGPPRAPPGWNMPPHVRPPHVVNVRPRPAAKSSMLSWLAGKPPKKKGGAAGSISSASSDSTTSTEREMEEWEMGFEIDFGPEPTREKDLDDEKWKNLGKIVAQWTNAVDTEFNTDSGTMPWYDDASSIRSSSSTSSSSSSEIVDR